MPQSVNACVEEILDSYALKKCIESMGEEKDGLRGVLRRFADEMLKAHSVATVKLYGKLKSSPAELTKRWLREKEMPQFEFYTERQYCNEYYQSVKKAMESMEEPKMDFYTRK